MYGAAEWGDELVPGLNQRLTFEQRMCGAAFASAALVNYSGALDKAELASMLDVLIHVCGKEHKGALSAGELAGVIFAEADTNKDGTIDVKEFKAWVQKHSSTSVKLLYMLEVFAEIIVHG